MKNLEKIAVGAILLLGTSCCGIFVSAGAESIGYKASNCYFQEAKLELLRARLALRKGDYEKSLEFQRKSNQLTERAKSIKDSVYKYGLVSNLMGWE